MLSKRQIKLLMRLSEYVNTYQTADELADYLHVSLRTIYQDISCLKKELNDKYVTLNAVSSKGYCLQEKNKDYFQTYLNELCNEYFQNLHFDEPLSRVHFILMLLLTTKKKHITYTHLQNELYISKSVLSADLKVTKELLKRYHLNLVYLSNYGLHIEGLESNKRTLVLKENLQHSNPALFLKTQYGQDVRILIEEVLNTHRYTVSDVIFQSLIVHVELALNRMMSENFVVDEEVEMVEGSHQEYIIAQDILKRLSRKFGFPLKQSEICYLSINMLGKKNYEEDEVISQELNDFIMKELIKIKEEYNLDFISDLDFRIALALHIAPMLKRLKYHMQMKNTITLAVKQNYPLAYDIATSITKGIYEVYGYKALDDETAYLAIHINLSMEQDQKITEPKKILLICPNRKSETLLLRQQIYRRFRQQIQELSIVTSYRFSDIRLEDFDVIFTTEEHAKNDELHAVKIHYFLEEKDYIRIELALNGIKDVSQLKDYIADDLMYFGRVESKHEIIKFLCEKAEQKYEIQGLYEQVLRREKIGGTFYGNYVAIPHPDQMITMDTFIALGILERPIEWQENAYARVILLVCIEKNNTRALQLWYYLSKIISDEVLVKEFSHAKNCSEIRKILETLRDLQ